MDKGSSLKLDLMILENYVVIMDMLMSLYLYMYVCMSLSDKVVRDHDFFMLMFICMYVCMYVISPLYFICKYTCSHVVFMDIISLLFLLNIC